MLEIIDSSTCLFRICYSLLHKYIFFKHLSLECNITCILKHGSSCEIYFVLYVKGKNVVIYSAIYCPKSHRSFVNFVNLLLADHQIFPLLH
jgi:hypothetical protein